jgi:hypothetical protein
VLSPYRNYRWGKLVEHVCLDDNQPLIDATALWFARQAGPGVRTVGLSCVTQQVEPPGSTALPPVPQTHYLYTVVVK